MGKRCERGGGYWGVILGAEGSRQGLWECRRWGGFLENMVVMGSENARRV